MSLKPCDYYLFGKQHRVSFRIPSTRNTNVLDLVYFDVCGPIDVESLGGNKYFVTFIDDASQKVWVYFLKTLKTRYLSASRNYITWWKERKGSL